MYLSRPPDALKSLIRLNVGLRTGYDLGYIFLTWIRLRLVWWGFNKSNPKTNNLQIKAIPSKAQSYSRFINGVKFQITTHCVTMQNGNIVCGTRKSLGVFLLRGRKKSIDTASKKDPRTGLVWLEPQHTFDLRHHQTLPENEVPCSIFKEYATLYELWTLCMHSNKLHFLEGFGDSLIHKYIAPPL